MVKPNIIFILTDQQRYDTCGCYGQELNITPNLDKMAREGVLFTNTFTCQPVCGPARSCIQTGKYATETMCYRNGIALPISDQNIANHFFKNGYQVGYIGKWHLASNIMRSKENIGKKFDFMTKPIPPELRGGYNDYWLAADLLEFTSHPYEGYLYDQSMNRVDFKGYRVDCITDFVLDYLISCKKEKPFFLFISYLEPHQQNDLNRFVGPKINIEEFKNFKVLGDLEETEGDWRENYPDYLACCHSIDINLGRIENKLRELNLINNTVILFTSDHGCHFKTRNTEYKRSCHESSIHIPLIIKGTGFSGGKKVTELISLIDIPPTLLKCADIVIPKYMRGRPIQDLINGNAKEWHQEVFIQISESQVGRAIRTKKWKYSVRAPKKDGILYAKSALYMEDLLYDLENDPFEKNNLIKDSKYAEIRYELAETLKNKMIEAGEDIPTIIPNTPK